MSAFYHHLGELKSPVETVATSHATNSLAVDTR